MGIKIKGVAAEISRIRRTAHEVHEDVKEEILKGAERIFDLSVALSPYKTGALEKAHNIDITDKGRDGITVEVYVDDAYPAGAGKAGAKVGDYLDFIHNGDYNVGPGTAAKPSVAGMRPGPEFVTRAVEHLEDDIIRNVNNAARRAARRRK